MNLQNLLPLPRYHPHRAIRWPVLLALGWLLAASAFPGRAVNPVSGRGELLGRTWQTDDGLPRNTITAIAQTPDGYLWLGTPFGLIRFDGRSFTAMEDEVHPAFTRGRTRVLSVDRFGRLWIGTGTAGVIRYDGHTFTSIGAQQGLPHPTISALCEDLQGHMWIGFQEGRLAWVDDEDKVHPVPLAEPERSGPVQLVRDRRGRLWFAQRNTYGRIEAGAPVATVTTGGPVALCPGRDGGMWVSAGGLVTKLPPPESAETAQTFPSPSRPTQPPILLEDRQGHLWMACQELGLFRLVGTEFRREFATDHRYLALFEDQESNLWTGTEGGGLTRLRPRLFQTVKLPPNSPQAIVAVCEDNAGAVWLSAQGPGLFRRSPAGELTPVTGFTNIATTTVLPHPDGGVWVGTVDWGPFRVADMTPEQLGPWRAFQSRQIRAWQADAAGRLWLGCLPDGLFRLEGRRLTRLDNAPDQPAPRQAIWSLAHDSQGRLWLGTIAGELWRYDGTGFVSFTKQDGLPGASIGALHFSRDGDLWIGTLGGGLGRMREGKFVFADVRHGLTDDVISGMVEDDLGWFWLGTDRGIVRVRKADLDAFADGRRGRFHSVHFGRDDGLENVECIGGYQPSAWRTRAGEIWFATTQGAVTIHPHSLPTNLPPPSLVLETITVDEQEVLQQTGIKIAYGHRRLTFRYTAPSFTAPEHVRFRHRLDGFDLGWVEADANRVATYPRLAPGRYVFRLTASHTDGAWAETALAFPFEVTPAYWQTAWFRGAVWLAFGALVAAAVRYRYVQKMRRKLARLERERAVEQERMRIARDIHDDLGARLTQVAFLSDLTAGEIGRDQPAGERLAKIADGSREAIRSLEEIVWAVNPRRDLLPHLVDYLSHYANEFFRATPVRCRQDLPLLLPEIPVSAELRHHLFLACKEAMNNIQKHAHATEVWLRVRVSEANLEIEIEDNGRGLPAETTDMAGNGLGNLQTRLAQVGGRCLVESQPGRGTRVRFLVPLPVGPAARVPAPHPPTSPKNA
ncbi:MAG: two-component regulator propeller domain-containing protein [Limisphaerales bacterium]